MPYFPVVILFGLAFYNTPLHDPVLESIKADLRVLLARALEMSGSHLLHDVIVKVLMEPLHVHRVQRILHDLEPIAGNHCVADVAQNIFHHVQVPTRQKRFGQRTQVREKKTA